MIGNFKLKDAFRKLPDNPLTLTQPLELGRNKKSEMYGYFRCSKCNSHWESAHVYRKSHGGYYRQECKKCRIMCSPYRVEDTVCSMCGEKARDCDCDKEHTSDPNKPHRSDLCEKCRSGRRCQRN